MNAERLLKLADGLERVPRKAFDFNRFVSRRSLRPSPKKNTFDCGFVGCAIGWTPVIFPRSGFKIKNAQPCYEDRTGFAAICRFFGLDLREAGNLFVPDPIKGEDSMTPKQVAKRIRKFVREKRKEEIERGSRRDGN